VKDLIIGAHGLLPILEILEPCAVKSRPNMILQLLKIVNAVSGILKINPEMGPHVWCVLTSNHVDYFR